MEGGCNEKQTTNSSDSIDDRDPVSIGRGNERDDRSKPAIGARGKSGHHLALAINCRNGQCGIGP